MEPISFILLIIVLHANQKAHNVASGVLFKTPRPGAMINREASRVTRHESAKRIDSGVQPEFNSLNGNVGGFQVSTIAYIVVVHPLQVVNARYTLPSQWLY